MIDVNDLDQDEQIDEYLNYDFANLSTLNLVDHSTKSSLTNISGVEIMKSPSFVCTHVDVPCKTTVDTGVMSNIISLKCVRAYEMKLSNTRQDARQLDGS